MASLGGCAMCDVCLQLGNTYLPTYLCLSFNVEEDYVECRGT